MLPIPSLLLSCRSFLFHLPPCCFGDCCFLLTLLSQWLFFVQELKMPKTDGVHPLIAGFGYRDANGVVFGNPKFHKVLSHVLKSKRHAYAPADLAFVQVVITATLGGQTLGTLADVEGAHRRFLLFAKERLGRHAAVVPDGEKERTFFLGRK